MSPNAIVFTIICLLLSLHVLWELRQEDKRR